MMVHVIQIKLGVYLTAQCLHKQIRVRAFKATSALLCTHNYEIQVWKL